MNLIDIFSISACSLPSPNLRISQQYTIMIIPLITFLFSKSNSVISYGLGLW